MSSAAGPKPKGASRSPPTATSHRPHDEVLAAQAKDIFTVLLILRWVNVLCLQTFFQPDEYFQALEPAWNIAFGPASGAWLTWEWQHQLRSSLHPALFAGAYVAAENVMKLLHCVGPLRAIVLAALPRAFQAVFAAIGDFYTWKLAEKVYGQGSNAGWAALWVTILNPWQWYCSTRTFSNSLETTLTIMALYHWPWELLGDSEDKSEKKLISASGAQGLRLSLLLAAVAVVLRPTNIFIWLSILTLAFTRMTLDGKSPLSRGVLVALFSEIVLCGTFVLGVSVVSDRFYFGFWTLPQYKWLYFNMSQDLAVFYGRNDWHYFLTQGIPLLTTTVLPFSLVGLYRSTTSSPSTSPGGRSVLESNTLKTLSFAVLTTVGTLSLISHKEVRFIYPFLPILHVLAAPHVASFFTTLDETSTPSSSSSSIVPPYRTRRKPILYTLVAVNVVLASYLSLFHQAAPVSVLTFLRHEYERLHTDHLELGSDLCPASPHASGLSESITEVGDCGDEFFALFLLPCHSTPWRSHLVYPGLRARALTCEPPLDTAPGSDERAAYLDEADRFYAATTAPDGTRTWGTQFLSTEVWPLLEPGYPRGGEVPRYVVGFEGIENMLLGFFDERTGDGRDMGVKLRRVWEGWNGLFNEDWRRRGLLVVWDTGIYPNVSQPVREEP